MLLVQPLATATVRQLDGFTQVAIAEQRQKLPQGFPADPQHLLPDNFLDFVKSSTPLNRLCDLVFQLFEERQQVFTLENIRLVWHLHYLASLGRDIAAV